MTAVVLVTHDGLGECLMRQAEVILDGAPAATTVAVDYDTDPDRAAAEIRAVVERAGDTGVLILTDLPGATPHNLACMMAAETGARVVSGVNLPMLLKVLNYLDADPDTLVEKALAGARNSLVVAP